MKVHIAIDTKTFVRFWLVVIGFAFAILALYSARTALIILGAAFFLAMALNTPVSFLAKHLPGRSRVAGTAIAYILVVAFLVAVLFFVIPPIIQQTVRFASTLPVLVDNATNQWHGVNELLQKYHMEDQIDKAVESVKDNTSRWAGSIGTTLIDGLGSVASVMTSGILVFVLTFLMLVEGPEWLRRLWGLYNDQERMEYHRNLANRMYSVVNGYITGQLTVSALDGFFAGLTVFMLSLFLPVPANLAMPAAAILFVLSLIPMFGATIGGLIVFLLLLFNSPTAAIIFAIYFVIYQQVENNLISPSIQARKLELSPLAILVAVTIGLYVFGIVGGIISIPIAGCIKVLVEDYLSRARKERQKSKKPLNKLTKKLHSARS